MIRKKKFDSWEKRRFPSKDDSEVVSNHRNKKSSTPKKNEGRLRQTGRHRHGRDAAKRSGGSLSLSLSLSFFLRRSQSLYLFVSACLRLRRLPRHAMRRGKRSAARRPISRHQRPPPSHAASQKGKKKPVQLGKRRRQTRNSVKTQQTYGQLYFTGTINPVKSGNRIRSSNKFEIEKTRS